MTLRGPASGASGWWPDSMVELELSEPRGRSAVGLQEPWRRGAAGLQEP